ncbi:MULTISPECIES: DUF4363 family protein [unclassified Ruminococcus]|uniref:DUF4363 family protein n=1 Tax=unclassified Ruminococcus TaxID=2608920 RepID=UPI00210A325C|nr:MULTISPECIES: DUF4363 family protein [unclassified Ruminococcus]MCQ4022523.1 DUF4363 family protein [Ruminococcus sp. zg-924]MCQ4115133.1 DUF4363 family protein [Ruminococcus sp. zg-921]
MKRLWSAFACLVIALSLCAFEMIYTTSAADGLEKIVLQARREFKSGSGGSDKAVKTLERAEKFWDERESVMNMFLYHDSIEMVGVELECAKSLAMSDNYEADVSMLEVLGLIKSIREDEQPAVDNIL